MQRNGTPQLSRRVEASAGCYRADFEGRRLGAGVVGRANAVLVITLLGLRLMRLAAATWRALAAAKKAQVGSALPTRPLQSLSRRAAHEAAVSAPPMRHTLMAALSPLEPRCRTTRPAVGSVHESPTASGGQQKVAGVGG